MCLKPFGIEPVTYSCLFHCIYSYFVLQNGRLQSGDHILQIGEVNLRGMGSEQVAAVLRQSGSHVRLVVARPVEPTSPDFQALGSQAPIVPTKVRPKRIIHYPLYGHYLSYK